ncbi:MAG: tripartite tricarboxylate transporter substrate binding protein [Betaproteobacteria bacterium]|nr:tripartite tricarboxylate transporter substrate binding protein [Betaproteobacteria bacterium]
MKIITWRGSIVLALTVLVNAPVQAQYPTRAVRLIVPFAAGSATDTVARFVQAELSAGLGQQLVIDNRAGAAGNLGAEIAARAPADGYTVLMGNISHSISMTLYTKLGFDLINDFAPVTQLASGSFTLAAHPSLPARSVKELIALAKKRPDQINVATAGAALRLAAKMLDSMAGIKTTEVNYKSTPQAVTAVLSGEASVGFPATSAAMPHARAGKLRALAVTSAQRTSMAPGVPTVAEAGLPGYEVTSWYCLMVPARTSKEIIARLHGAAVKALDHSEVKKRFATTDLERVGSTPEQCGTLVRREIAKWAKVIKESGIRAD